MKALSLLTTIAFALGLAARAEVEVEVRERVAQLDHADFSMREEAAQRLVEIGTAALPALREALDSDAPERRNRARQVLDLIQRERIRRGFAELASGDVDVEQGMFLIALMLDSEVTKDSIDIRLDALAKAVRDKLDPTIAADPAKISADEAARVLVGTLRDEFGLGADHDNYDHPDNSSIHRVLQQKDGLPILLSEIAVAVGRRAGLKVHGLAFPSRYMFVCENGTFDPESPQGLVIDPQGGWLFRNLDDVERVVGHLEEPAPAAVVTRMLNNLESDYLEVGDVRGASLAAECRAHFE